MEVMTPLGDHQDHRDMVAHQDMEGIHQVDHPVMEDQDMVVAHLLLVDHLGMGTGHQVDLRVAEEDHPREDDLGQEDHQEVGEAEEVHQEDQERPLDTHQLTIAEIGPHTMKNPPTIMPSTS